MAKELDGKVFLITGATEGIGKAAALSFAKGGATLVLVGRNREKTERTVTDLRAASGNEAITHLLGDMSKIADVRTVAEGFRRKHDRLDVLVNNAGAVFNDYSLSADGIEMTFALNHVGYFVLTVALLDLVRKTPGARIVSTSSGAHRGGKVNLDTIVKRNGKAGFSSYSDSKLANILFTRELARQLDGSGATANCMHPGFVRTGFGMNNPGWMASVISVASSLFARTPEKGAETLVWLATSPEAAQHNGQYFYDKKIASTSKRAQDDAMAKALWELSEKLG